MGASKPKGQRFCTLAPFVGWRKLSPLFVTVLTPATYTGLQGILLFRRLLSIKAFLHESACWNVSLPISHLSQPHLTYENQRSSFSADGTELAIALEAIEGMPKQNLPAWRPKIDDPD